MLVFSAIVPHALDLLKNPKKAPETLHALEKLQKLFAAANVDVTIILSPHGPVLEKAFAVNMAQEYEIDLLELGVKLPRRIFKGDPLNTIEIRKKRLTDSEAPVTLVSSPKLDYGTAIPLSFLIGKDGATIIPISPSQQSLATHHAFGETLKDIVMGSTKRFAVVASSELAHTKDGKVFDDTVIATLQSDTTLKDLLAIETSEEKKQNTCGLRSLAVLMGVVSGLPWRYNQLSYESTFDKGLLVAELQLGA